MPCLDQTRASVKVKNSLLFVFYSLIFFSGSVIFLFGFFVLNPILSDLVMLSKFGL